MKWGGLVPPWESSPIFGSPSAGGASGDIGAVLVCAHARPVGGDQSVNTKVGASVGVCLVPALGNVGGDPDCLASLEIGCLREKRHGSVWFELMPVWSQMVPLSMVLLIRNPDGSKD